MDQVHTQRAGDAGLLVPPHRHGIGGCHNGLRNYLKLQTTIESEVHCFRVARLVAGLRFQAEGPLFCIHP